MGSLEARGIAEGDRTSFLVSSHRRSIFWWLRMVGFVLPSGVAPGGVIKVIDLGKLRNMSCECYETLRGNTG